MTPKLSAELDRTIGQASVLSAADARHFVECGYVVVHNAFSRALAEQVCATAWNELESDYDVDRNEASSWHRLPGQSRGIGGYVRTKGSGLTLKLRDVAPRALAAQVDVAGGVDRFQSADGLAWSDTAIGNLGRSDTRPWASPSQRQAGWHKDGWHFRHFLDSPEQGLLTVPIFSSIAAKGGGTFVAVDSIRPVAELLHDHPEGLHPDGVQGGGYLIPGLIDECSNFVELTGEPGDLVIVHPFVLHRVSQNSSSRPRFIANVAVVLAEPMNFVRPAGECYSLVELAILNALGVDSLDFVATGRRALLKPAPFRNDEERGRELARLETEMSAMAAKGRLTPTWASDLGYGTNSAGVG